MVYILLIIGFILLIKGADFFVEGSSNLAQYFKVPSVVIGLTLVAFGTSAPEAAISITAALSNSSDLSVSNIIGSNIFNLFVVLGLTSLFKKVKASSNVIKKDYRLSIFFPIILFAFIMINYIFKDLLLISRLNGLILILMLFFYLRYLIKNADQSPNNATPESSFHVLDLFFIIGGLLLIIFGGELTVNSAVSIARLLGLSERVIGLTIVAVGTSLPELCTSLVAAIKGKEDIAVGNVIGSNIFNILFVLGFSSLINPLLLNLDSLIDLALLIIGSFLVYLYFHDLQINRREGLSMLLLYIIYCIYILIR